MAGDDNEEPIAILDSLLERGADINQLLIVEGMPPRNALSHAIERGKAKLQELLRDRGAKLPHELSIAGIVDETGSPRREQDSDELFLNHLAVHVAPPRSEFLQSIVPDEALESVRIGSIPAIDPNHGDLLYTVGLHCRGIEFYVELGRDWPPATKLLESPKTAWPIMALRRHAREINIDETRLPGFFGVLANGDPPEPFSEHTSFSGWLFAAPENEAHRFRLARDKCVTLYQLFPLYSEELEFHARHGFDALLELIDESGFPDGIVDGRNRLC